MNLEQLRKQHPRLIYQNYRFEIKERELQISFQFLLEPDIYFTPTATLPIARDLSSETLNC